jgi:hypothetical protein
MFRERLNSKKRSCNVGMVVSMLKRCIGQCKVISKLRKLEKGMLSIQPILLDCMG